MQARHLAPNGVVSVARQAKHWIPWGGVSFADFPRTFLSEWLFYFLINLRWKRPWQIVTKEFMRKTIVRLKEWLYYVRGNSVYGFLTSELPESTIGRPEIFESVNILKSTKSSSRWSLRTLKIMENDLMDKALIGILAIYLQTGRGSKKLFKVKRI